MAVQFKLDAFQGPLDLLLHLISKHKLNICDIEISLLLDQYLEYMNQLDEQDYESAGEFLEMAARLIYIKTMSLLPQPEEAEELKRDLQGQIIEYSICKKAAEDLKNLYVGNDIFVRNPVAVIIDKTYTRVHEPEVLYNAYMGISAKSRNSRPLRAEIFSPIVSHKIVSVTSKIIFVLKKLYKTGVYNMSDLYEGVTDKSEKVATFLAVLELTKSGRIYINEDNSEIRFIRKEKNNSVENEEIKVKQPDNIDNPKENRKYITSDNEDIQADNTSSKSVVKVSTERVYSEHVISCPPEIVHSDENDLELLSVDCGETDNLTFDEPTVEKIKSQEYVIDVFKPNYWNRRKYYWGYSSVGNDNRCNYWRYG
ncbi:MAG: segregation and condensation protein A [Oscillospiraceae bacterium]